MFREHIASGTDTLRSLAEAYYGNPREAVRIFNANRVLTTRGNGSPGFLRTLNDPIPAGTVVLIP